MNALQHLAPVTLADRLWTYGALTICVVILIAAFIAWGPQWVEECRTWLPREDMPPTPIYLVRIGRRWDAPAAKGRTAPTVISIAEARERKRLGMIVSPFSQARRVQR